jgi:hypothetical protein
VANQENPENDDPHEEIVRLEERIEELAAKIESCRKFILASRIAVASGGLLLAVMLFGAIRSDLGLMAVAVSLLLGGIVVWGSNSSTAKEAAKEIATAESERAALIEQSIRGLSHRKMLCNVAEELFSISFRSRVNGPIAQGRRVTVSWLWTKRRVLFAIRFLRNNSRHNWLK